MAPQTVRGEDNCQLHGPGPQRAFDAPPRRGLTSDAGILLKPRQAHVEHLSANVVKIHIQISDLAELLLEVPVFVVEDLLDPDLFAQPLALVGAACDGDDSAAVDFGQLASLSCGSEFLLVKGQARTAFCLPERRGEELTTEPTAPAAPETTTVSPGLILPTSCNPQYAVCTASRPSEREVSSDFDGQSLVALRSAKEGDD